MKKISIYLLIFQLSFVYTSEGIHVLTNGSDDQSGYIWADMDNSENKTESKESKEQKENGDFLANIFSHMQLSSAKIDSGSLYSQNSVNFSSSGFGLAIYSPPEHQA